MSGATIKPEDRPGWRPVKRNCHTCGWADAPLCRLLDAEHRVDGLYQWIEKTCSGDTEMPPHDADGCPGWKPKPGAENTDPDFLDSSTMAMGGGQVMRSCGSCNFMPKPLGSCWADPTDGIRAHLRDGGHNCPGWQRGHCPMCDDGHHFDSDVCGPCRYCGRTGPDERVENTDRAQVAALGGAPFVTDETAVTDAAPTFAEWVQEGIDNTQTGDITVTIERGPVGGWRGHLPICRGPGHTTAMRLRRAGMKVRARKVRR